MPKPLGTESERRTVCPAMVCFADVHHFHKNLLRVQRKLLRVRASLTGTR
jgi:hypothetical protein